MKEKKTIAVVCVIFALALICIAAFVLFSNNNSNGCEYEDETCVYIMSESGTMNSSDQYYDLIFLNDPKTDIDYAVNGSMSFTVTSKTNNNYNIRTNADLEGELICADTIGMELLTDLNDYKCTGVLTGGTYEWLKTIIDGNYRINMTIKSSNSLELRSSEISQIRADIVDVSKTIWDFTYVSTIVDEKIEDITYFISYSINNTEREIPFVYKTNDEPVSTNISEKIGYPVPVKTYVVEEKSSNRTIVTCDEGLIFEYNYANNNCKGSATIISTTITIDVIDDDSVKAIYRFNSYGNLNEQNAMRDYLFLKHSDIQITSDVTGKESLTLIFENGEKYYYAYELFATIDLKLSSPVSIDSIADLNSFTYAGNYIEVNDEKQYAWRMNYEENGIEYSGTLFSDNANDLHTGELYWYSLSIYTKTKGYTDLIKGDYEIVDGKVTKIRSMETFTGYLTTYEDAIRSDAELSNIGIYDLYKYPVKAGTYTYSDNDNDTTLTVNPDTDVIMSTVSKSKTWVYSTYLLMTNIDIPEEK